SNKTRREDMERKIPLYQNVLRVPELFFYDPTRDYLPVRLLGFRLVDGKYQSLPMTDGRMRSEVLGLEIAEDGKRVWLYDPTTSRKLPAYDEVFEEVKDAAKRATEAEAENMRLKAEI